MSSDDARLTYARERDKAKRRGTRVLPRRGEPADPMTEMQLAEARRLFAEATARKTRQSGRGGAGRPRRVVNDPLGEG